MRLLILFFNNRFVRKIEKWLYKGGKYQCPFCFHASKKMAFLGEDLPVIKEKHIIGAGRRRCVCYQCGSIDRERLIFAFLKYQLDYFADKDKRILHIAPERTLAATLHTSGFTNYVCGDLSPDRYKYPFPLQTINILNIPYRDNYFDLVICNHVLEHIPNDRDAMRELYRVLKAGGLALLQVPFSKTISKTIEDASVLDPQEREKQFGQYDHVRIYGLDYMERLKACGFKVKRRNISLAYQHLGVNKEEDIFIAEK